MYKEEIQQFFLLEIFSCELLLPFFNNVNHKF